MIFLRSLLFAVWFALVSLVLNIAFLPALLMRPQASKLAARVWGRATLWGLRVFTGIRMEVRGAIPRGAALVASKHMSMWDTLTLFILLPDPAVVLKRELLSVPFYGWYVKKSQMIPIDRDAGARSLRDMAMRARAAAKQGRPVLIFPEGTRKRPGEAPDYKPGVAGLYALVGAPCVPVALNSGCHWTGFLKKPGTIVLEFLPAIPPGLPREEFMPLLESRIEGATRALIAAS